MEHLATAVVQDIVHQVVTEPHMLMEEVPGGVPLVHCNILRHLQKHPDFVELVKTHRLAFENGVSAPSYLPMHMPATRSSPVHTNPCKMRSPEVAFACDRHKHIESVV